MSKTHQQITFWILVFVFLNLFFGSKWNSYIDSFYFTSMLMPVSIGTSYFFHLLLVPRYLAKGRYLKFGLYTIYTIVVSVFLSAVVAMVSFVVLADLQWKEMNPVVSDLYQMGMVIYFIAILFSFIRLYSSNIEIQKQIVTLKETNRKNLQETLTVRSNRETVSLLIDDIFYIESLSDYVKIHTSSNTVITKERISSLEKSLPEQFIRTHRSFLINRHSIESFGHDFTKINSQRLPIGRKYKKEALAKINTN